MRGSLSCNCLIFTSCQTPQLYLLHILRDHRAGSRKGELIYPQAPPVEMECVRTPLWGRWLVFLMPASEVAWECGPFLGQGTYSTQGLHLGAQRRWGRRLYLWASHAVIEKQNLASTKCSSRSSVCPVDSPRRSEILEKMEDSRGLRARKQAGAAAAVGFMMYRKLHVKHIFLRLICRRGQMEQHNASLVLQMLVVAKACENRSRSLAQRVGVLPLAAEGF